MNGKKLILAEKVISDNKELVETFELFFVNIVPAVRTALKINYEIHFFSKQFFTQKQKIPSKHRTMSCQICT